jgi:hypothetical protein
MQEVVKKEKYTEIHKQSDVEFWLNGRKYGNVSYSFSCIIIIFNGLYNQFIFSIKAAYSFYNVAGSVSWVDLMSDALVLAKKLGKHFFLQVILCRQLI